MDMRISGRDSSEIPQTWTDTANRFEMPDEHPGKDDTDKYLNPILMFPKDIPENIFHDIPDVEHLRQIFISQVDILDVCGYVIWIS